MRSMPSIVGAVCLHLLFSLSQAQSWDQDTTAVRLTLDDNGLFDVPMSRVVTRVGDRVQAIRFDSLPLQSLGFELFHLDSLKSFSAQACGLASLPPTISQWSSLTELNLNNNSFKSLPSEIGDLGQLTQLKLRGNALTFWPTGFLRLKNLLYLDMGHNLITSLPADIDSLVNLTYLFADQDSLTGLPENIAFLPFLKVLNVSGNAIVSMPYTIAAMDSLETLDMSINSLTTLPDEYVLLTGLKELDLHGNKLCSLSPSLSAWAESKQSGWLAMQLCSDSATNLPVRPRDLSVTSWSFENSGLWVSEKDIGIPLSASVFNTQGMQIEALSMRREARKGELGWLMASSKASRNLSYVQIKTRSGFRYLRWK